MLYGRNLPQRLAAQTPTRCRLQPSHAFSHTNKAHQRCQRPTPPNRYILCKSSLRSSAGFNLKSTFSTSPYCQKDSQKSKPELFTENTTHIKGLEEEENPTSANVTDKEAKGQSKGPPSDSPSSGKTGGGTDDGKASNASSPPDGKGAASGRGGEGAGGKGRAASKPRKPTALQQLSSPPLPSSNVFLAIGIAGRPLFPGLQKAITIRDENIIHAIRKLIYDGSQYVGAFLFKDENMEGDVIEDQEDVYDVGVLAQITDVHEIEGNPEGMTVVVYPHRRIRMRSLIRAKAKEVSEAKQGKQGGEDVPDVIPPKVADQAEQNQKQGDVVASFHEEGSTSQGVRKETVKSIEPLALFKDDPVTCADVEYIYDEGAVSDTPEIIAYKDEITNTLKMIASRNHLFRDQVTNFIASVGPGIHKNSFQLADLTASLARGDHHELQSVLEETDVQEKLKKALIVLKKELKNAETQMRIKEGVEGEIMKRQREYYLTQQMKGIRKELGIESDGKDKLVEKFRDKAAKLTMPEAVRRVFDEEMNKLAHLEPAASEFNVTRNYLDWLTQIPWGQRSAESFSIGNAKTVLDEDHYGLQDVKDRILEFIAVGKLRGTVEGKILCFVGPPGVGKTSIGKSIARALNRQYYRFSVGGLWDVAEIKGHRRTYVGALPGRIIQALKKCQTENPLILIDEIDKVGRGNHGDPSSALLELLDPEQNSSFLDHYLDVPVDLSKVLFVCTANMTDTIPRPLIDRMEMIELSGYVADEKMAIADRYLAPAAKELAGLGKVDVKLNQDALEELIKSYCRESGVRSLKKQIEKVYRKSALKIVQDLGESVLPEEEALTEEGKAALEESKQDKSDVKTTPEDIEKQTTVKPRVGLEVPDTLHVTIDKNNLKDYVGPPLYTSDRLYDTTPPGVAMGLAWTQMGGAALYVESILESALKAGSRPGMEITGNLKNVMKESASIAYSFAKSVLAKQFPENRFFDHARVHMHCPEGAIRKDGPSAGITMATSLLSLALDKQIDPRVAMTGELTVTGKVLRIGGLREKTIAARRAGSKTIIFPKDNLSKWLELPENIKEGLEGHPVEWYSDVFDIVFKDLDKKAANELWKDRLRETSHDKPQNAHEAEEKDDEEGSREGNKNEDDA